MYTIIWDYTSITHITTRFCLKISVNTIRFFIIWLTLPFGDLLQIDFGSCVWAVKMTVDLLNKQGIPTNNNYWLWEILTFWSGILQQNKFNPQTSSNLLRNLGFPWISGGNLNGAAVARGGRGRWVSQTPRCRRPSRWSPELWGCSTPSLAPNLGYLLWSSNVKLNVDNPVAKDYFGLVSTHLRLL